VGRHGHDPSQRQDRGAPSRRARKHHLCREGPRAYALGRALEFVAEAGPGDFIYVPPYVPHQEINAGPPSRWNASSWRSGQEPVRGQPRHRAGGAPGIRALDRPDSQVAVIFVSLSAEREKGYGV